MTLKMPLIALMLVAVISARAHDAARGPNGGRVVEAGAYHVELVAAQDRVEVFLTDSNDKAVPPTGFKGTAILVVSGKPQRIVLEPASNTRLLGKANVVLPNEPKGVVQISAPNGATAQAQFK